MTTVSKLIKTCVLRITRSAWYFILCVLYYWSCDYCVKVDEDMCPEDNKISLVFICVFCFKGVAAAVSKLKRRDLRITRSAWYFILCVLYYRSCDYCVKVDKDMCPENNKISLVLHTVREGCQWRHTDLVWTTAGRHKHLHLLSVNYAISTPAFMLRSI